MGYQASYRIWRPKLLSDVIGQEHITKTIKNALTNNKLSHAYLFTGPRGTGKTSAAKIIAKAVNCQDTSTAEPCDQCEACRSIANNSVVDVIEIDAASNNGVDEIRDIRDKVKFAPSSGIRYKVYIIDEVHMLSTGAFNALLKTLEEPPKHVIFILATTEPHKIPLTIISRCQRFDFKRITPHAMIERMEFILSHSNTSVSKEALAMIARVSEGGMRDALSLLDQAISYCDEEVSLDDILAITGSVSQSYFYEVAKALLTNNVVSALQAVDMLISLGKDPIRFIEDFIFFYRDMLIFKASPQLADCLERVAVDDDFVSLCESTPTKWIYHIIETLNEILQDMKWSSHPKIFIEVAIVKISSFQDKKESNLEYQQLLEKVQQLEEKIAQGIVGVTQEQKQPASTEKKNQVHFQIKSGGSQLNGGHIKGVLKQASKQILQEFINNWSQIMEIVKKQSVPAHAWLSDSKPVAASKTGVLLAFQNEMHRDMIDTKFRQAIEQAISQVIQEKYEILTLLTRQWETVKEQFVKEQRGEQAESQESEPIVDEAIKLVGTNLIEIIE